MDNKISQGLPATARAAWLTQAPAILAPGWDVESS
jgi:hypothetical protein